MFYTENERVILTPCSASKVSNNTYVFLLQNARVWHIFKCHHTPGSGRKKGGPTKFGLGRYNTPPFFGWLGSGKRKGEEHSHVKEEREKVPLGSLPLSLSIHLFFFLLPFPVSMSRAQFPRNCRFFEKKNPLFFTRKRLRDYFTKRRKWSFLGALFGK